MMKIDQATARKLFLESNGLLTRHNFAKGQRGFDQVIRHLGYIQIDTINVIERCHHHIFFTRLPDYKRSMLEKAQSEHKSIFEYWTHALAYIPTEELSFYRLRMQKYKNVKNTWFGSVTDEDYKRVIQLIKKQGPQTIRDMKDEKLVEKKHLWASRKPSKKILQLGFYRGDLTISKRHQMLKEYEWSLRHFNWDKWPKAQNAESVAEYTLRRALKAQNLVSLDSICYLNQIDKKDVQSILNRQVKSEKLITCQLEGDAKTIFYVEPNKLENKIIVNPELIHILSPFDPLVIQRKRLKQFFNYDHKFEAYIPAAKRQFGYFALPILAGDQIVAVIDFKTDRQNKKLLIQQWTWLVKKPSRYLKSLIEKEIDRFSKFQLAE